MIVYAVLYFHNDKLVDSYVFDNEKEAKEQWAWVAYNTGHDAPEETGTRFFSDNGFGETDEDMYGWEFLYIKIHAHLSSTETEVPNIDVEMAALMKEYG